MKKTILFATAIIATALASCENASLIGNHNVGFGNMTYNYAYVDSSAHGKKCFHVSNWKEYGPDPEDGMINYYVGLEIKTYSGNYVYFYEQNLSYTMTFNEILEWRAEYGNPIE